MCTYLANYYKATILLCYKATIVLLEAIMCTSRSVWTPLLENICRSKNQLFLGYLLIKTTCIGNQANCCNESCSANYIAELQQSASTRFCEWHSTTIHYCVRTTVNTAMIHYIHVSRYPSPDSVSEECVDITVKACMGHC